jgi:hypothetical protein
MSDVPVARLPETPRLRWSDTWWILAVPVYSFLGTLRHEGSHALAGLLEGARVLEFRVFPTLGGEPWILWGYVVFDRPTSWLTSAAPYIGDLLVFILAYAVLRRFTFQQRWLWLNVAIVGLLGPLLDNLYNYTKLLYTIGDLDHLMEVLPDAVVHAWFLSTTLMYLVGTLLVLSGGSFRQRRSPDDPHSVS